MNSAALLLAIVLSQSTPVTPTTPETPATPKTPETPRTPETPKSPETSPAPAGPAPDTTAAPSAAKATPNKRLTVSGLLNVQYAYTDAPEGTRNASGFEIRRARIRASGELLPQVGYTVMVDGATPDNVLKDAFVSLKLIPGAEIRLGQFKTPFGYENPESDMRLLWVNTSFVVGSLARGLDPRDLGAVVVGNWALTGPLSLEATGAVVNGFLPTRRDDDQEKHLWGRAGLSAKLDVGTARAGVSYGRGRQRAPGADRVINNADDTFFWFNTLGVDVTFDSPWVFAVAEYMTSAREPIGGTAFDASGWYLGAYGKTPWKAGPIFRAETFDPNNNAGQDLRRRYTLGAYYDLETLNARFIFNYELDRSEVRAGNTAILFAQVVF